MSDHEQETFEKSESGARKTQNKQAGSLKKGDYVVIKGRPCKIVNISTSKTGKHGSTKVNITALDIFTGKKYEEIQPSSANMEEPIVTRKDYQLSYVDGENLVLLQDDGTEKIDVKLPSGEVGEKIKALEDKGCIVTVMSALGEEVAISVKEDK